jgi:hypothetical protein
METVAGNEISFFTERLSVSTHVFDGAYGVNSVKKHVFGGLHSDYNCFTLI